MSTIKVEIVPIRDVRAHPKADNLELATINSWQLVVPKGRYTAGEPVVYFESGTVLPPEVAERFGVTSYLAEKLDINGDKVLVVHRIKLRSEPSFGLAVAPDDPSWPIGMDVAAHYGATKFQPPAKNSVGNAEVEDWRFPEYSEIENLRSYPDVIQPGELVVATEKLHGGNVRVGFFIEGNGEAILCAGSRRVRRKPPVDGDYAQDLHWSPWAIPEVAALLHGLIATGAKQAVLYGELFGGGIQKGYDYGLRTVRFRAFDLMIDGKYANCAKFVNLCGAYDVPTVPLVYLRGFDLEAIKKLSEGPSELGGAHQREGVVVRPTQERDDPKVGRVILKYVSDDFLFGKHAMREDTSDV